MPQHEFGGDWTAERLEQVRKHLSAYTTIFNSNPRARKLTYSYVDAFAGTGYRSKHRHLRAQSQLIPGLAEPETEAFLKGSARIALEVEPPFKHYLFVEQDPERAKELEQLKADFSAKASRIQIEVADANDFYLWRYIMPIVHVNVWEGFGQKNAKTVIQGITGVFVDLGIPNHAVEVVVHEIPKSHWGVAGEPASERLKDESPPQ